MSEPPIDYPDDEPGNGVPPGQHPPQYPQYPQYPPQYPQYPPQYPQYGYPAPNAQNPNAISVGGVIGGLAVLLIGAAEIWNNKKRLV